MTKPVPVYLAGSSSELERVKRYAALLEDSGFVTITHKWWEDVAAEGHGRDHELTRKEQEGYAWKDLRSVEAADIIWALWPDSKNSEGCPLEVGYAISECKALVVTGARSHHCIFTSVANYRDASDDCGLHRCCAWRVRWCYDLERRHPRSPPMAPHRARRGLRDREPVERLGRVRAAICARAGCGAADRGGAPVKPLELIPVRPVASQGDFFAGTSSPVYPADACARGDALKTYRRFDRGLGEQEAARMLGITAEQLRRAEVGAYAFDLDLAKLRRFGARAGTRPSAAGVRAMTRSMRSCARQACSTALRLRERGGGEKACAAAGVGARGVFRAMRGEDRCVMAKQDREPKDNRESPRSFVVFFDQIADGDYQRDASEKLFELCNAVRDEALRCDGKVKGKMTMAIEVEIDARGQVGVGCDITIKKPVRKRVKAAAWITASGNLTLQHPRQTELPLREVARHDDDPTEVESERASAREV